MLRKRVERRLVEVSGELERLGAELGVADEQLAHLAEEEEDARIRSLVSETPVAERERREATRHAEAMRRHRASVLAEIRRLEQEQDELLDRLRGGGS